MRSILLLIIALALPSVLGAKPIEGNAFSQLVGFKGGGEYYPGTQMTGWTSGFFFENVIDTLFGVEIEVMQSDVPVTNAVAGAGVTNYGIGNRSFIEISAALKFYVSRFSFYTGVSYNDFLNGYIIYNNNASYADLRNNGNNYLSAYFGTELVAQISADLFAKVGVRFVYGIMDPYWMNPNTGIRFLVSFAYGI